MLTAACSPAEPLVYEGSGRTVQSALGSFWGEKVSNESGKRLFHFSTVP
jgi:hypothetical protein